MLLIEKLNIFSDNLSKKKIKKNKKWKKKKVITDNENILNSNLNNSAILFKIVSLWVECEGVLGFFFFFFFFFFRI